ncbi:YciE/YciF family protein, partial [Methylobacterium frigidaeris]
YEIARYGTLKTWALQLGHEDAAALLDETLQEEKKTDQLLTELAERLNVEGTEDGDSTSGNAKSNTPKSSTPKSGTSRSGKAA